MAQNDEGRQIGPFHSSTNKTVEFVEELSSLIEKFKDAPPTSGMNAGAIKKFQAGACQVMSWYMLAQADFDTLLETELNDTVAAKSRSEKDLNDKIRGLQHDAQLKRKYSALIAKLEDPNAHLGFISEILREVETIMKKRREGGCTSSTNDAVANPQILTISPN
jgi:hypothetical protein